jgi:hypothetical protein
VTPVWVDQVKLKCRPLEVSFGGRSDERGSTISVNMEGRSLLLYNAQVGAL